MGDYDTIAVINYIQTFHEGKKVAYIGHSQGTTQMFYGLATNQDLFADKISVFAALGPVLELSHVKSNLLDFIARHDTLFVETC